MTTVRDIANKMEEWAPLCLAAGFDNVGLLVGSPDAKVKRILTALDADTQTINEAIGLGADMLITHHPIMFKPIQKIVGDNTEGKLIISLIKNGLALYSAHTNLDSADGGVNDVLADKIGLSDIGKLIWPDNEGSARTGRVKPLTLGEFAVEVGKKLGSSIVKVVGDKSAKIEKAAVSSGGGAFIISTAKANGCDVIVTGEAKYSDEQLAAELGIALIEAGHFETENVICAAVREYLQTAFDDIEVLISKRTETYYFDAYAKE